MSGGWVPHPRSSAPRLTGHRGEITTLSRCSSSARHRTAATSTAHWASSNYSHSPPTPLPLPSHSPIFILDLFSSGSSVEFVQCVVVVYLRSFKNFAMFCYSGSLLCWELCQIFFKEHCFTELLLIGPDGKDMFSLYHLCKHMSSANHRPGSNFYCSKYHIVQKVYFQLFFWSRFSIWILTENLGADKFSLLLLLLADN